MSRVLIPSALIVLASALLLPGCPHKVASQAGVARPLPADLEGIRDCAPARHEAARILVEQGDIHMRAGRYDEAEIALLAARRLVERAKWECEEAHRLAAEAALAEPAEAPVFASADAVIELPAEDPAGLVRVHFGFDEAILSDEARGILRDNAEVLRRRADLRIQVEGHCDERGSTEYNLTLGDQRARAVQDYLVNLGILPGRLEIVSYGEERPADYGQDESAWARNRRGEFTELDR